MATIALKSPVKIADSELCSTSASTAMLIAFGVIAYPAAVIAPILMVRRYYRRGRAVIPPMLALA